jgi:hypothetical protein
VNSLNIGILTSGRLIEPVQRDGKSVIQLSQGQAYLIRLFVPDDNNSYYVDLKLDDQQIWSGEVNYNPNSPETQNDLDRRYEWREGELIPRKKLTFSGQPETVRAVFYQSVDTTCDGSIAIVELQITGF